MESKKQLGVLGSANVDYFLYMSHIPAIGETIQASKEMYANGGKGANQATAIGKLLTPDFGKCLFIGQVGEDENKKNLTKEMTECNVELGWISTSEVSTGKAFIFVDENTGDNSIVIYGAANTYYPDLTCLPKQYA